MDEAWNNFMITGRVTDYLKYKESHEGSFDTTGRGWENRPDGTEYRSRAFSPANRFRQRQD